MDDMWSTIAAERQALADDLAGIDAGAWNTPSLCAGWTVRDTTAHIIATAEMTPPKFVGKIIGSGFSFQKMVAREIAAKRGSDPPATLAHLRAVRDLTTSPPGPKTSWLGETLVHAEDVRRPLGLAHTYPIDALVAVGDFYKGSNTLIGAKTRIEELALEATDADWSHGAGPGVEGPMLALVMAMTGRATACDDLTGDGVTTLRTRCGAP